MSLYDAFEDNKEDSISGSGVARTQKLQTAVKNEAGTTALVSAFYDELQEYAKTHPNVNIGVIAAPGSGKTFLVNAFLHNLEALSQTDFDDPQSNLPIAAKLIKTDSFGENTNVITYDSNRIFGRDDDPMLMAAKDAIIQTAQEGSPTIQLVEHPTKTQQKSFDFIISLSKQDAENAMGDAADYLEDQPRDITIQFPDDFAEHASAMAANLSAHGSVEPPKISALEADDFIAVNLVENDELYDEAMSWMQDGYEELKLNVNAANGEIEMALPGVEDQFDRILVTLNEDGGALIEFGQNDHLGEKQSITKEQADAIKNAAERFDNRAAPDDLLDHNRL